MFQTHRDSRHMLAKFAAMLRDETGATAIEYALMAAWLSVLIISSVKSIGVTLNTMFSSISTQLK
jgi:pilus assembly protein Flp/PilA